MNSLKQLIFFIGFSLYATASVNHPIMDRQMIAVDLKEVSPADTLEFLRTKGTEYLQEAIPRIPVTLIFEYRFNPRKYRKPVVYSRRDLKYGDALKEVLHQMGLTFTIESVDRITIDDEVPAETP